MRAQPPRAPRRLERLPDHLTVHATRARPTQALRGGPQRCCGASGSGCTRTTHEPVSAEGGYLRETGNLVFHVALCGVIVGIAAGHLVGWRGDVIVAEGEAFASTVGPYNTLSPGPLASTPRRSRPSPST